jgi:hypothetical protein
LGLVRKCTEDPDWGLLTMARKGLKSNRLGHQPGRKTPETLSLAARVLLRSSTLGPVPWEEPWDNHLCLQVSRDMPRCPVTGIQSHHQVSCQGPVQCQQDPAPYSVASVSPLPDKQRPPDSCLPGCCRHLWVRYSTSICWPELSSRHGPISGGTDRRLKRPCDPPGQGSP